MHGTLCRRSLCLSVAVLVILVQQAAAFRELRRLDQTKHIDAECAGYAAKSTMPEVSYVIESACNTAAPKVYGCIAKTACQICFESKNNMNANLMACKVLRDTQLRAQQAKQQQTKQFALSTDNAESVKLKSSDDKATKDSTKKNSSNTAGKLSAQAMFGPVAAVVVLIGGVFMIKRHRERLEAEEALSTPRDSTVLVAVQSRTQIATI